MIEDLATRPELREPALGLGGVGGEFLQHDLPGLLAKSSHLAARWPEYFLVLLEDGVPVARAAAVPVGFPTAERPELPDHGWDAALIWAAEDLLSACETNTLIALEVMGRARPPWRRPGHESVGSLEKTRLGNGAAQPRRAGPPGREGARTRTVL